MSMKISISKQRFQPADCKSMFFARKQHFQLFRTFWNIDNKILSPQLNVNIKTSVFWTTDESRLLKLAAGNDSKQLPCRVDFILERGSPYIWNDNFKCLKAETRTSS